MADDSDLEPTLVRSPTPTVVRSPASPAPTLVASPATTEAASPGTTVVASDSDDDPVGLGSALRDSAVAVAAVAAAVDRERADELDWHAVMLPTAGLDADGPLLHAPAPASSTGLPVAPLPKAVPPLTPVLSTGRPGGTDPVLVPDRLESSTSSRRRAVHPTLALDAGPIPQGPMRIRTGPSRQAMNQAARDMEDRIAARILARERLLADIQRLLRPGLAPTTPLPRCGSIVDDAVAAQPGQWASAVAHGIQAIDDGVLRACKFKVGATSCREHRWLNRDYGYYSSGSWRRTHVVFRGHVKDAAAMEKRLIAHAWSKHAARCDNHAAGGENVVDHGGGGFWEVYIVWRTDPTRPPGLNCGRLHAGHLQRCETCQRWERGQALL